jgi:hypothetical protein
MKAIIYLFGIVFSTILAPVVGLMLGIYTFFVATFAFVEGCHNGMMISLFGPQEEESEDIWENHINRMKNKKD